MSSLKKDFPSFVRALWLADTDLNVLQMSKEEYETAFGIYLGLDIQFFAIEIDTYGQDWLRHNTMSDKLDRKVK